MAGSRSVPAQSPPRRRLQGLEAHLRSREVARVVYGAIVGLALVVALEHHPPGAAVVAATLAGSALALGLAELYSDILGTETRTRSRVARDQVRRFAGDSAAVVFGAAFPAVWFVLASAGAMQVETAFTVAKWTGLGLLGFYGFAAGRLSGGSVPSALLHALAVAAVGGFVIALKALLH